jgi:hypothetical protein
VKCDWEGGVERGGETFKEELLLEEGSLAVGEEVLETGQPGRQLRPVPQVGVAIDVLPHLLVPLPLLLAQRLTHSKTNYQTASFKSTFLSCKIGIFAKITIVYSIHLYMIHSNHQRLLYVQLSSKIVES